MTRPRHHTDEASQVNRSRRRSAPEPSSPTPWPATSTSCARCSCSRSSTTTSCAWLCEHGRCRARSSRARLFREGEPATCFYVLLDGSVALSRQVGADDVEISRTEPASASTPAPGRPTSATGCRRPTTSRCGRWRRPGSSCSPPGTSRWLMRDWFPMAVHLLEGLFFGNQSCAARGQPARAPARARFAVGRPDPRAEQPGRGRRAGHVARCATASPACGTSWR